MERRFYIMANITILLTLALVGMHSIHTSHAIHHVIYGKPGESCCSYVYEAFFMGITTLLSTALMFFSLLAYLRDRRRALLSMALGYSVLFLNCVLWLFEDILSPFTLFNHIRISAFFLAFVLLFFSFFTMRAR